MIMKPISHLSRAHKLEKLLKSIQDIFKEAKKHGIKPIKVAAGEVYEQSGGEEREQRLIDQRNFVNSDSLFGREDDINQIVAHLQNPENDEAKLNIIGIVGMAGMGKTALSKKVADNKEMKILFDPVISVTVSHDYKLSVVLKRIAGKVMTADQSLITGEADEIVLKVKAKLEDKKYLLILDDVWDTIDWEPLKAALLGIGGREGTTILVTSRRRDVVDKLKTNGLLSIYPLRKLSDDDSWSLFMDRLSAGEQLIEGSDRKDIATRMVSSCGGLPLALRLLGDLLRNHNNIEKWREFEESEAWKKNDEHDILPSLKLSYMYLKSPALKTCFSYCALFGEDEVIGKDCLVRMWMAQGFLQPQGHMKMEVLGEEFFNDLLNSSLFHEPVIDQLGNVKAVKMHDLVRALAFVISKGDIWCCSINKIASGSGSGSVSDNEIRHISIPAEFEGKVVFPTNRQKLRTLFMRKYILSLDILNDCKNLRVLSIGFDFLAFINLKEKDWKLLGALKHLRFLEIFVEEEASKVYVKKNIDSQLLPQIAKLYHLETLTISVQFVMDGDIPVNLRRYLYNEDVIDIYEGLDNHVDIPKQFGNLVNLRHLSFGGRFIDIYEGLGLLTALQTLPRIYFKESNEGRKTSELQKLTNLKGRLAVANLGCISEQEAQSLCLEDKSSLTSLCMTGIQQNEIMEALKPHRSLIDLEIRKFHGTILPTWLSGSGCFSNLVSLKLRGFKGAQGELNLEKLTSLRLLGIFICKQLTVQFYEFMPCKQLEELHILDCDEVVSIPDMSPLTKLRKLTIARLNLNTTLPCSTLSFTDLFTHGHLLPTLNPSNPLCQSLKSLTLEAAVDEDKNKSLPDQLQHFAALQTLTLLDFKSIKTLPDFIGNLTSLTHLKLSFMSELRYLPSRAAMDRLSNLTRFSFAYCPKLVEEFAKWGEEWSKISHLRIDDDMTL